MIGGYFHVKRIGRGGFGEVWQAIKLADGAAVAIKYLANATKDALTRFHRETLILYKTIKSPYIVQIKECNLQSNPPYIIMEYCEFGSLHSWVKDRKPWRDVASALLHAAHGVTAIHELKGFHRDIKPDNLLLKSNGQDGLVIKVGDLGLARLPSDGHPMSTTAAGTEGYIAPELLIGKPMSQACDIYSLGITGIEFLTGTKSADELDKSDCPPSLKDLLRSMVEHRPEVRPSIVAVVGALENVLREPPMPVKVAAPAESSESSDILAPLLLAGLLVGGLILFAAADNKR